MELYLRKSYYKTASLICDASRSCALLAGHASDSEVAAAAEEYGYHLGLAFQIVDDVLDFAMDDDQLGKPAGADLSLGLATAPILFAAQDHLRLLRLVLVLLEHRILRRRAELRLLGLLLLDVVERHADDRLLHLRALLRALLPGLLSLA